VFDRFFGGKAQCYGFIAILPAGNTFMDRFRAAIFIKYSQVNRHGLWADICNDYAILITNHAYLGYGLVGYAVIKESAFPKPVKVYARAFIHAIKKIERHGVLATPLLNIIMQSLIKQIVA